MKTQEKLNVTMLCDFYELTMGNGYFQTGYKDRIVYFDVFFRKVPDGGGFAIAAGLEQLIDYIENLHFSEEDIASSGLDYLALGHVHQYSCLRRAGETFWAYPGCPEGRGFDELGEKGVLWLEVEKGRTEAEFVPLCRRRYQILSVDLTGQADPAAAVLAAMPTQTGEDIYRLLLTGERGLEGLDLGELERELSPRFWGLTLRDHTRAARALWERRGEDTLTGLFLREMEGRCQAEPENEAVQLAVRFGLAALEHGEDVAL